MIKIGTIEKKIREVEEVDVSFVQNGVNVRSDARIDADNYKYKNKIKNSATVSQLRKRLKKQYPGFEFEVKNGNGDVEKSGHKHIGTVRDSYLDEE